MGTDSTSSEERTQSEVELNLDSRDEIPKLGREQTARFLEYLREETVRTEAERNPPGSCRCSIKKIINYGVPLLTIILIIAAAGSRERIPATGEKCLLTTPLVSPIASDISVSNLDLTSPNPSRHVSCFTDENDGLSSYKPVSNEWQIVLSLIPFVCVFQGVLAYNLSSRYVAPFTLVVSIILGLLFFENKGWFVNPRQSNSVEVSGLVFLTIIDRVMWTIFEYAFNVFTAFFFLRVLELWGVVTAMREEFEEMCKTDTRKVLLILFCFAVMIAVVAPGGSNFLIAGAIMVEMNHQTHPAGEERDDYDKRIGAICLFGNGLTSAFNLVGVCVIAIASDILPLATELGQHCTTSTDVEDQEVCATKEIGKFFSMMFFIHSLISPILMAGLYSRKRGIINKLKSIKDDLGILLLCGFVYAAVQLVTSTFIGPELVCLLSAGCSLVAYYVWLKYSLHGWNLGGLPNFRRRPFVIPFVILIVLLCIVRLIPGVEDGLKGRNTNAESVLDITLLNVRYLNFKFVRRFGWLAHSGVVVLFVTLITPFVVPFYEAHPTDTQFKVQEVRDIPKHKHSEVLKSTQKNKILMRVVHGLDLNLARKRLWCLQDGFNKSIGEALPVMVSIGSYASIAKVMSNFEMTQTIALGIVSVMKDVPGLYAAFIPVIGMLGSGLTGSTTTSNFLFGRLQVETAVQLKLVSASHNTLWEVAGDQILGATAGEIISPMNAVFSTLLLASRFPESELIRLVLPLFCWWLAGCMLISVVFIVPKGGLN